MEICRNVDVSHLDHRFHYFVLFVIPVCSPFRSSFLTSSGAKSIYFLVNSPPTKVLCFVHFPCTRFQGAIESLHYANVPWKHTAKHCLFLYFLPFLLFCFPLYKFSFKFYFPACLFTIPSPFFFFSLFPSSPFLSFLLSFLPRFLRIFFLYFTCSYSPFLPLVSFNCASYALSTLQCFIPCS